MHVCVCVCVLGLGVEGGEFQSDRPINQPTNPSPSTYHLRIGTLNIGYGGSGMGGVRGNKKKKKKKAKLPRRRFSQNPHPLGEFDKLIIVYFIYRVFIAGIQYHSYPIYLLSHIRSTSKWERVRKEKGENKLIKEHPPHQSQKS